MDSQEKDFLSEQPGWRIAVLGFFAAMAIGFLFRNAFSSENVTYLVKQAASRVHRGVEIQFQSARLSLSDGSWPQFRVVVEGVSAKSQKACWLSPTLEVEKLVLPISITQLLQGRLEINEIFLRNANLVLNTEYRACEEEVAIPSQGFAELKKEEKNPLESIRVDHLTVHYLPKAFTSFAIKNLLYSVEGRQLQGDFQFLGETTAGDYFSQAFLTLQLDTDVVTGQLKGNWREGQYQVHMQYSTNARKGDLTWSAQHVPLNQLVPILRKYQWVDSDPGWGASWLSGNGVLQYQPEGTVANINNLEIDGDIGVLSVEGIKILDGKIPPLSIKVENLKLDHLFQNPPVIFGSLGLFSGSIFWHDKEKSRLEGHISGMELIFSNKGIRQLQKISFMHVSSEQNQSNWDVRIKDIRPVDGIFLGDIKLKSTPSWSELKINIQLDELSLGSSVQSLITNSGNFGSWSGRADLNYKNGQWIHSAAKLKGRKVNVEDVQVESIDLLLSNLKENFFDLDFSLRSLEIKSGAQVIHELRTVFSELQLSPPIQMNQVKGRLLFGSGTLQWKNVKAQLDKLELVTQGGWDADSTLSGQLRVKGKKWSLSGTRDEPQLVMDKAL